MMHPESDEPPINLPANALIGYPDGVLFGLHGLPNPIRYHVVPPRSARLPQPRNPLVTSPVSSLRSEVVPYWIWSAGGAEKLPRWDGLWVH